MSALFNWRCFEDEDFEPAGPFTSRLSPPGSGSGGRVGSGTSPSTDGGVDGETADGAP
jgi:hypothetical protein